MSEMLEPLRLNNFSTIITSNLRCSPAAFAVIRYTSFKTDEKNEVDMLDTFEN